MSLKVCSGCGTVYLPAEVCPQCGSEAYRFAWEEAPKLPPPPKQRAANQPNPQASLQPPEADNK